VVLAKPRVLRNPKFWALVAAAMLVTLVVAGYWIIARTMADKFVFKVGVAPRYYSSSLIDLLRPNAEVHVGVIPLTLAFTALLFALARKQFQLLVMAIIVVIAGVLMAGPFHNLAPYSLLHRYWPFMERTRTPVRLIIFILMGTGLVCAWALGVLGGLRRRILGTGLVVAVVLATLITHVLISGYYRRSPRGLAIWTHRAVDPRMRSSRSFPFPPRGTLKFTVKAAPQVLCSVTRQDDCRGVVKVLVADEPKVSVMGKVAELDTFPSVDLSRGQHKVLEMKLLPPGELYAIAALCEHDGCPGPGPGDLISGFAKVRISPNHAAEVNFVLTRIPGAPKRPAP
jgi:hypothetical protein